MNIGNKKATFLSCNPEQVYAAILELPKNNDLFQKHQNYSHRALKISRNFLEIFSVWLQMHKNEVKSERQRKMEYTLCVAIACNQL